MRWLSADVLALKLEFEKELSSQREQMQSRYLSILQDQMSTLMAVVKSPDQHTSLSQVEGT